MKRNGGKRTDERDNWKITGGMRTISSPVEYCCTVRSPLPHTPFAATTRALDQPALLLSISKRLRTSTKLLKIDSAMILPSLETASSCRCEGGVAAGGCWMGPTRPQGGLSDLFNHEGRRCLRPPTALAPILPCSSICGWSSYGIEKIGKHAATLSRCDAARRAGRTAATPTVLTAEQHRSRWPLRPKLRLRWWSLALAALARSLQHTPACSWRCTR